MVWGVSANRPIPPFFVPNTTGMRIMVTSLQWRCLHAEPHRQLPDAPGHRTGPGRVALTLPRLKTKIDNTRLGQ